MRAALLFCVLVLTSASPGPRKKADQKFLKKQDNLLLLFVNIHEPNYNKDQQQLGNTFDFDKQLENFVPQLHSYVGFDVHWFISCLYMIGPPRDLNP
ncbi:hypothetical protein J6590_002915 [Homalodisca vitripennis]|nr:hypothetical protein J6590_002915 [Homalodisca vitripennis]